MTALSSLALLVGWWTVVTADPMKNIVLVRDFTECFLTLNLFGDEAAIHTNKQVDNRKCNTNMFIKRFRTKIINGALIYWLSPKRDETIYDALIDDVYRYRQFKTKYTQGLVRYWSIIQRVSFCGLNNIHLGLTIHQLLSFVHNIARRHEPVIWMTLHNEGHGWMDT